MYASAVAGQAIERSRRRAAARHGFVGDLCVSSRVPRRCMSIGAGLKRDLLLPCSSRIRGCRAARPSAPGRIQGSSWLRQHVRHVPELGDGSYAGPCREGRGGGGGGRCRTGGLTGDDDGDGITIFCGAPFLQVPSSDLRCASTHFSDDRQGLSYQLF